jgi:hypothetical protein
VASANNTEKFQEIWSHLPQLYMPIRSGNSLYNNMLRKNHSNHYYLKTRAGISITPMSWFQKTGIQLLVCVSDYRAPRYSFEKKKMVGSSWDFFNKSTWKLFIDCYRPIYFRLFIIQLHLQLRKYFHLHLSPIQRRLVLLIAKRLL